MDRPVGPRDNGHRPSVTYLRFILSNSRFLGFGMLLMFCSAYGQTYFISLFSAAIRQEFGLTHGDFGFYYFLGTIVSGFTVAWAGRFLDVIGLRQFTLAAMAGLFLGSLAMALVPVAALIPAIIFVLRLGGQGLMPLTAQTSMARYFARDRGKALSIATLGLPFSEAILPIVIVAAVAAIGWRWTWAAGTVVLVTVFLPLALLLLRGHDGRHARYLAGAQGGGSGGALAGWTRAQVARDYRFWLFAVSALQAGFTITGFFFHQIHLAEAKGWSLPYLAGTFPVYALMVVTTAFLSGPLIDRFTARRLMPIQLPPLALSVLVLALFDHPLAALAYMALAGFSIGFGHTLTNAVLAEMYGTAHLGAIRGLVTACSVCLSALSPLLFGLLIDDGVAMESIAFGCFLYGVAGTVALIVALWRNPADIRPTGREP